MCIYDTTRYACTGEEIALVQRCSFPEECIPHIRQVLYRTSVCHLCAVAGLEEGAEIVVGRDARQHRWAREEWFGRNPNAERSAAVEAKLEGPRPRITRQAAVERNREPRNAAEIPERAHGSEERYYDAAEVASDGPDDLQPPSSGPHDQEGCKSAPRLDDAASTAATGHGHASADRA